VVAGSNPARGAIANFELCFLIAFSVFCQTPWTWAILPSSTARPFGGEYCRWTAVAQNDSDPVRARIRAVDCHHRRAIAHAAAELPELQNCASALSDVVPR